MSEPFKKDIDSLYFLTSQLTDEYLDQYTRDSLLSSNLDEDDINTLSKIRNKAKPWRFKIKLYTFSRLENKELSNEQNRRKHLMDLARVASQFRAETYNLAADAFLYSLSLNAEQICEAEQEFCCRRESDWETIKEEIIEFTNKTFKNKGTYDTGLSKLSIHPIEIHKNPANYRRNRLIALQAMTEHIGNKLTQLSKHRVRFNLASSGPNNKTNKESFGFPLIAPIARLDLFLNIYDHYHIFGGLGGGPESEALSICLTEFKNKGLTIYPHKSMKTGCFAIIEKGTLSLKNLSYQFLSSEFHSNSKFDFFEDVTIPQLSFGIGYYGSGKNMCPPMSCLGGTDSYKFSNRSKIEHRFLRARESSKYYFGKWIESRFK